ncbi:hypothetical protein M408DRAFT_30270 [Serendipita vermifera MAFF 305830]|uniref:Protein kinase domain-containing protein n=1 Tax=Serendipita vermifera MAFF 305830 TaxID=933852 RepID=A0A0C2WSN0_SERVB|nr:hypothetical protein M408DRAFT_30270 [Serendipita vermifera MAFF 305830]
MEVEKRIILWKDVVSGVSYLHSFNPGLIHGDLKPRNILIDESGNAQICDFGLSRIFLEEGSTGMTTTSAHTGTERYLARELVVGGDEACPTTASDVHAMGCIGLEFLFSQRPYPHRKNNLRGVIYTDIKLGVPPCQRPDDLSPTSEFLWALFVECWNLDPDKRPDAPELYKRLVAWLERPRQSSASDVPLSSPSSNQGPAPAPIIYPESFFWPLLDALEKARAHVSTPDNRAQRVRYSVVEQELPQSARTRLGLTFEDYVAAASRQGIVVTGDSGDRAWIAIKDWN